MGFLSGGADTAETVLMLSGLAGYSQGQQSIAKGWRDAAAAQDTYSSSAERMSNTGSILVATGAAVATSALVLGRAFLTSAGNMESTRNGFATMLGSMDKAKSKIAELQAFAASTPLAAL
jgi:hypothetical protein